MDLWPFLLYGSLFQLNSAHDGFEPLQEGKAVCSRNMCNAQMQSVPGCQAAVTEARPLPVIINPFAALALSSHLALSGAAPFSALLGDWERLLLQLGVGRWENERQWSKTWRKEGPRTQAVGAITSLWDRVFVQEQLEPWLLATVVWSAGSQVGVKGRVLLSPLQKRSK